MQQSKNLFKSKTFWLNILSMGAMVVPGLPIPPETLVWVAGGLNIANRLLTQGPVHVLKDAATEP